LPSPLPKKKTPTEIRSLARSYTEMSLQAIAHVIQNGESEQARISAAFGMLDRGWGKPAQQIEHTGKDGENEIRIIMRTITEGRM
jgi:hypothetical protein